MIQVILPILLTILAGGDFPAANDVQRLLDTIEALQEPVEDFRCEFEGDLRAKGKVAEDMKIVRDDGLYESFSGIYIWKRGGDTHSESLHRRSADNQIEHRSVVVRMHQQQAEEHRRLNDAALGSGMIKKPKDVRTNSSDSLGSIFLLDTLKKVAADETFECSVSHDQTDESPLEIFNVALKGVPDSLFARYWVDLRRNGHVVRVEGYSGKDVSGRLDIKLAPFKVGDVEVWMPVSGESMGYGAVVDGKPVVTKEPTALNTIYVVQGTMAFNKRPGPEAFSI